MLEAVLPIINRAGTIHEWTQLSQWRTGEKAHRYLFSCTDEEKYKSLT
jgi:hypothetical protein